MPEPDIARIYRREFAAAHIIAGHPKCGRMHGHNYTLIAKVYGQSEEWLDFEEIKRTVDQLVDSKYDHRDIGNMTCERLARQIQEQLRKEFNTIVKIELWETGKFGVSTL
ncbi:MAG TPA: 6-carboxytetrahydropterin synthase [Candidatus Saccharimonadales bacterium]|nr:6-carboxytetrahydropterin synthase [Candidatus Saccharimonadales bacterium]